MDFPAWLLARLKDKGWSQAELARRASVSRTAISDVLAGKRGPGPELCRAIARAFKLTEEEVFRQAGLLEDAPGEHPPDVNYLVNTMTDNQISEWIEYGRYLLDREERKQRENK